MSIPSISNPAYVANAANSATIDNGSPSPATRVSNVATDGMQAAEPNIAEVQKATRAVQEIVHTMASNLEFSVDQDSGRTVVKLTDAQTGETIRQIPSREMLELAHQIERFQGLLLKEKA